MNSIQTQGAGGRWGGGGGGAGSPAFDTLTIRTTHHENSMDVLNLVPM